MDWWTPFLNQGRVKDSYGFGLLQGLFPVGFLPSRPPGGAARLCDTRQFSLVGHLRCDSAERLVRPPRVVALDVRRNA